MDKFVEIALEFLDQKTRKRFLEEIQITRLDIAEAGANVIAKIMDRARKDEETTEEDMQDISDQLSMFVNDIITHLDKIIEERKGENNGSKKQYRA